jgi:1-deoxy-D-xylulose-5-phosphate reductoisomerase
MSGARSITILGATGSVGESTAHVIAERRAAGDDIRVEALALGANAAAGIRLARSLSPRFVAVANEAAAREVREALASDHIEVGVGESAVMEAALRPADWVMSAIVGAAGMAPTLAALQRGATVALANKESMVSAGALLMQAAAHSGAKILPVDSEHNAIFQVFEQPSAVEKVTLTASGGPFRAASLDEMRTVTPAQAVRHPNWSMGPKISIDSATLMNKGLEVIEAAYLFALRPEQLDVLVHPQSVIHSLVSYCDGSVLAQLAAPDMRVPIAYALGWPKRLGISTERLDLAKIAALTFEAPDTRRFPALALSRAALEAGGNAPCILNAANEVAVESFLKERIGFLDIAAIVEDVLQSDLVKSAPLTTKSPSSLDEIVAIDGEARIAAKRASERRAAA